MLFDYFEIDANVPLLLGLGLGLIFGVAAQITRFCLRRAVASEAGVDLSALSVWVFALAVAIGGVQAATAFGLVDLDGHRLLTTEIPWLAIVAGGLAFGAGMVLTRGCASRLTVLSASGNLRAITVLVVFAVVAHATIKGVLAPVRTAAGTVTVDAPVASLASIPGFGVAAALALAAAALWFARRSGTGVGMLSLAAVIGLVAALGWSATSVLLLDPFDPAPVQSIAFTLPWADSLFWAIASTSITPGFGVGLLGGVLGGAFLSAASRRELALESFSNPKETLRYIGGGALMGVGGVLAGGCTVGAGLAGGATLSISALLALAAIITGAVATRAAMKPVAGAAIPAE